MRHTIAISDIHLCEVERTDGLWMRYRQAQFSPDNDLAAMLDTVRRKVSQNAGDVLCLVLNGDVFDFDAPRVVEGESVFHDLPRTAEHAVPAIGAILDDHPAFMAALGRVLADQRVELVLEAAALDRAVDAALLRGIRLPPPAARPACRSGQARR